MTDQEPPATPLFNLKEENFGDSFVEDPRFKGDNRFPDHYEVLKTILKNMGKGTGIVEDDIKNIMNNNRDDDGNLDIFKAKNKLENLIIEKRGLAKPAVVAKPKSIKELLVAEGIKKVDNVEEQLNVIGVESEDDLAFVEETDLNGLDMDQGDINLLMEIVKKYAPSLSRGGGGKRKRKYKKHKSKKRRKSKSKKYKIKTRRKRR